jgi:hypothetical protein
VGPGLFNGHDAAVPHSVQRLGEHGAHGVVVIGRDRRHAGVVLLRDDGMRDAAQMLDQPSNGEVDASLDQHGVATRADRLHAFADDRVGDDSGRRGAVTDDVVGLDRGFLDQLRAHVLELVRKVDLTGDRDAVVGYDRRAGDLLQDDVAPFRAERRLHGLGQLVDASQQQSPGILAKAQFLGHRSSNVGVGGLPRNYGQKCNSIRT